MSIGAALAQLLSAMVARIDKLCLHPNSNPNPNPNIKEDPTERVWLDQMATYEDLTLTLTLPLTLTLTNPPQP